MQDLSQQVPGLSEQVHTAHQHRQAVKEAFTAFFSGQACTVSQQIDHCQHMLDMNAVHSFYTPVPWIITLSDGSAIQGNGEMLSSALRDIHAHLQLCQKKMGSDSLVIMEIDATRF